jgi:phage terminase large subunit-like protein
MERWHRLARPEQLPPDGDWRVWYLCGGRGSGKTFAGSNNFADWILERGNDPDGEWGVVAPTWDKDARAVCVEGPSGLLKALGPAVLPGPSGWNRSTGELTLRSGARIYITSADDGARHIQGKNLRGCWCDEIGLWSNWQKAWDESIAFAVRMEPARIIVTGTPKKGHPLVKRLLHDQRVPVSRMSLRDNVRNLDPAFVQDIIERYAGSMLGRQEIEGEWVEDVSGALWERSDIEVRPTPLDLTRVVIAVDPSGAKDPESGNDAIGIVAAGFDSYTQMGHVLADYSLTDGPAVWARRAITAYHQHEADLIVAESNFGGEMVRHTIQAIDRKVPVKLVHASRGKQQRAEPVAMLYKAGRVFHSHPMPELEDELCVWVPGVTKESPNRLDAVVWALTELMLTSTEAKVMSGKQYAEEPVYRVGEFELVGDIYFDKER